MKGMIVVVVGLLALACSNSESPQSVSELEPVPTAGLPSPMLAHAVWRFDKPPTIDWQILDSETIVVATHVSTTAGVETVATTPPAYRPMHILTFRASEYLKGTGSTEFTVEVPDTSPTHLLDRAALYSTYAEAIASAAMTVENHNSKWDAQPAVLFLSGPYSSVASSVQDSSGSSGTAGASDSQPVFTLTNNNITLQDSFKYTVDTLSRGWLPENSGGVSGSTETSESDFITDGDVNPPPTISLSDLKARINLIQSELDADNGEELYAACVHAKYTHDWGFEPNEELHRHTGALSSGAPAGSEFGNRNVPGGDINHQQVVWYFTGQDADKFEVVPVAKEGVTYSYRSNRPLPAGIYELRMFLEAEYFKACNFRLGWNDPGFTTWITTVSAPGGTLHEAFFDPVESGEDEVSPASFSVGGTDTEITGLEWADGKVVLSLDPVVSLDGYTLDFIELDGTASLNLRGLDVEERSKSGDGSGTLKWAVADEPWEGGDKLMLRIREDGAAAPPTPGTGE